MKQSKLNKISDCFGGPIDCKQIGVQLRKILWPDASLFSAGGWDRVYLQRQ